MINIDHDNDNDNNYDDVVDYVALAGPWASMVSGVR